MSVSTDSRPRTDLATELPGSPAASRHRRSAWKDPRLFVGVALVAASALVGATLLRGDDPGVAVWAAGTALTEGQSLSTADLVRQHVRFDEQADADRYLPADRQVPDGARVTRAVGAGELLPRGAVRLADEEPLVEVPLAVATTALPATVGVGSVVDVWVVPDSGAAAEAATVGAPAELVLDDVAVLHVSRGAGALGAAAERQVIVGLGPDQQDSIPEALAGMAGGSVVLTSTR